MQNKSSLGPRQAERRHRLSQNGRRSWTRSANGYRNWRSRHAAADLTRSSPCLLCWQCKTLVVQIYTLETAYLSKPGAKGNAVIGLAAGLHPELLQKSARMQSAASP